MESRDRLKSLRKRAAAFGVLAFLGGGAAIAHGPSDGAHNPHGVEVMPPAKAEVRSKDGRVTIPFHVSSNHVVIPVTIQGTRLDVVLDTGMPMEGIMLYRNDKVSHLDLETEEGMQARVGGAGSETEAAAADIVQGLTVDIGDLRLKEAKAIVLPPVKTFAPDHDGVIGASIFRNFVVGIDFDASRITLTNPKRWKPPANAAALPISLEGNLPFADIGVLAADGTRVATRVVVDLGAGHPISLNVGQTPGIEVPEGAVRAIVGRGISGVLRGQVGRIAGVDLGGVVVRNVVATFPDEEFQRPHGMNSEGGNLGSGLLQHFNVAFDYGSGKLYLTPNKNFDRPFEWDMTGLWLDPDDGAALRVGSIVANSPAEAAGLQVGDIVAQVNGREVSARDLPVLFQQFRKEGDVLALTLTRDGKPIDATLRLKRLV